jgi:hypothetical protein
MNEVSARHLFASYLRDGSYEGHSIFSGRHNLTNFIDVTNFVPIRPMAMHFPSIPICDLKNSESLGSERPSIPIARKGLYGSKRYQVVLFSHPAEVV